MRKQETESVVTVLGELKQMDAQRAEEQRAAEERIRQARAAAEKARLEEKAQRERAERARAEKQRLEVEIAERRAAIEAHRQIEERRVAVETEVAALRERQTRPARHWLTVALLALVVAGQAVLLYSQSQRERELHELIEKYATEASARSDLPGVSPDLAPDPRVEPVPLAPDLAQPADAAPSRVEPKKIRRPKGKRGSSGARPRPNSRPAVADDCDPRDPLGCLPKSESNR